MIGVSWRPVSPISLNKPLWPERSRGYRQVYDNEARFSSYRAAATKNLAGSASPAYDSGRVQAGIAMKWLSVLGLSLALGVSVPALGAPLDGAFRARRPSLASCINTGAAWRKTTRLPPTGTGAAPSREIRLRSICLA